MGKVEKAEKGRLNDIIQPSGLRPKQYNPDDAQAKSD